MSDLRTRFAPRRVPYVPQLEMADCGPACLTMALRFLGRHVTLDEVRDRFQTGRDGSSAYDILEVARTFELRGRAVRLELDDLEVLPRGTILHWRMSHFVVLDRVRKGGIDAVDPDGGPRFVRTEELGRSFTGVAILLEPSASFEPRANEVSQLGAYARRLVAHSGLVGRTVAISFLLQAFALALPLATGTVVDRVVPRHDVSLLVVLSAGVAIIALYAFLAAYVRAHLLLTPRPANDDRLRGASVPTAVLVLPAAPDR
jgi:ABC-type bacteriocin/lantibiotic exporter with double-glycine peptidase domain